MQFDMFPPQSEWRPNHSLPQVTTTDTIAIDLETYDPHLSTHGPGWPWGTKRGRIIGVAIAVSGGPAFYLPFGHEHPKHMLDKRIVMQYTQQALNNAGTIVAHNAMYDFGWLTAEGITIDWDKVNDTVIAAPLIDENRRSFSLDNLGKDWLGEQKDEQLIKEYAQLHKIRKTKSALHKMPAEIVGPYAEQDAKLCLRLWEYCKTLMERDDLGAVYEMERRQLPMLIEMRRRGVRVDMDHAHRLIPELGEKIKTRQKQWRSLYGFDVNVNAATDIAKVFDHLGLSYERTPKAKTPSFSKEFLENHEHPFAQEIREVRKIDRTIAYLKGMVLEAGSIDGLVHCELHPLKSDDGGTVSGRYSCTNPNLQQVSARDPEASYALRSAFLAWEGGTWLSADYSSQEPRLTVHYAALTNQTGARKAAERYCDDPRTDYHQMVADLAGIERKAAKAINLGLAYGMGEAKLCHSLGLPTEWQVSRSGKSYEIAGTEGKELLEKYHMNTPFLKGLTDFAKRVAGEKGQIRTLGGRLCRFPYWESNRGGSEFVLGREAAMEKFDGEARRAFTHKALNRLIQGSAADQTKEAMYQCWKAGHTPLLQVHDELCFSVESSEQVAEIKRIMEECYVLEVPSVVDAEVGPNWFEAKTDYLEYRW